MQIALAVFGVYHHFELAHQLHRQRASSEDLLHLALGATQARRPSPLSRRHLSSHPHDRLPAQPLPPLSARSLLKDELMEHSRLRPLDQPSHRPLRRIHRHLRRRPAHRPQGPTQTAASSSAIAAQHTSVFKRISSPTSTVAGTFPTPSANPTSPTRRRRSTPLPTPSPFRPPSRQSFLQMGSPRRKKSTSSPTAFALTTSPAPTTRRKTPSRSSSPATSVSAKAFPIFSKPSPASSTSKNASPSSEQFNPTSATFSPPCPPPTSSLPGRSLNRSLQKK